MHWTRGSCWHTLFWWLCTPGLNKAFGLNTTKQHSEQLPCEPGYYCPRGTLVSIPCPRGTFGPSAGATSLQDCVGCPLHHYGPREGMTLCLPCGAWAEQPLPGQDRCVCQGEGRVFQVSDGQCPCAMGYQLTRNGEACELKVYEICKNGRSRNQHGECLEKQQWKQHCAQEVCQSPDHFKGYHGSLGLCLCRDPLEPEKAECAGWCRSRVRPGLQLVCAGTLQLFHSDTGRQVSVTGSVLETVLKHWDSRGKLGCDRQFSFSQSVYIVQTGEAGFYGLFSALPAEVQRLFSESNQEIPSLMEPLNTHSLTGESGDGIEAWDTHWAVRPTVRGAGNSRSSGLLNPIACLHLGDILLFTVSKHHFPQYDIDNLYNTNADFDWGPFRALAQELTLAKSAPSLFSIGFNEPGVYTFKLSSQQFKRMYVKVMPVGGECYETGPFFPTDPHHMTRMGIAQRRQLLLRPDWLVIGGLLIGAVVVLCLCVALLTLFREYGWPDKLPTQAKYRALQLKYNMDDYASKGSRVMAVKKTHRNLQVEITDDSVKRAVALSKDEFWDYEEQVDLEAFSASAFYDILLKHSMSVTVCLGQLRREVKQLYQGIMGKIMGLHPGLRAVGGGKMQDAERLCGEVEQEMRRRRSLASQLVQLLDSQLHILQTELKAQRTVHRTFETCLRECIRHLGRISDSQESQWDKHLLEHVAERVAALADQMADLVTVECQRQGAWAVLKEGTGARLLCPASGSVLSRDDMIASDGSVQACEAVHVDPCTGLIQPNPNTHMLLASGHSMPVPPDFFLHPQTGRLLPVAGNVGFDPSSSTLVFTSDSGLGEIGKWESPLLPFVPYPSTRRGELLNASRLRGLRAGQRLVLGGPMCDYDTGVLVPILAVTIHPQTGLVYPLGGVHVCPISRLHQPIQIGSPMLDPQTGNIVLITGVSLDPLTGAVLPVGGLLLQESFIEPLSGRMVRVGGASIRGGKLVPHAGGFQSLLDNQVLVVRLRVVELLQGCNEVLGSGVLDLQMELSRLRGVTLELEQAWKSSHHCMLQLLTRLEVLKDWAWGVAQDGGSLGDIQIPDNELSLPALPGMEYPDPGGSGLYVPVLGAQLEWTSGRVVPLAGTMEDADGKGLVPIRFGALTVDPVTGAVAPVVGARLDILGKSVVPVTVSQSLIMGENPDSVQVEALQREYCLRIESWRQRRQSEEELLGDLDRELSHSFYTSLQESDRAQWTDTERQLRDAACELHEAAQSEAQRRALQSSELSLLLPAHILLTLTKGDEEEWEQQCHWHTKLMATINKISVCMEKLQHDKDQSTAQRGQRYLGGKMKQRELWEQLNSSQADLEAAFVLLHSVRELGQLCADTAQAMLSGSFWYKDFGLIQPRDIRNPLKMMVVTQHKILPHLERLTQFLEESKFSCRSTSTHRQPSSELSAKQTFGLESCSRALTASVSAVKGTSTQSLKDQIRTQTVNKQNGTGQSFPLSSSPQPQRAQRKAPMIQSEDVQPLREPAVTTHINVPILAAEEWAKLLELSPVFQLIREVEQKLRDRARDMGLLQGEHTDKKRHFIDFFDAQWKCEGELIKLNTDTLSPREFLVCQHGQFLLRQLHSHNMIAAIKLQLASSLPSNNYFCNAFRNSFFYQEADETLYVRSERLQSVGGFSLLLLHCAAHISTGDMSDDSCPSFQRAFFKVLQVSLSELFHCRLGGHLSPSQDWIQSSQHTESALKDLLLERVQKPGHKILSEEDVAGLLRKHKEASVFLHLESLLREKSQEVTPTNTSLQLPNSTANWNKAPP
ncbi:uncharacterized protein si:dkey-103g5.4 [Chanos chanos]|uniref:Uncharacterized protein si:dkey-103g5.4 n=1 Tax=Chanos chanos TaxID=29144 RepID=A0A6J2VLV6_CHACN|nr:uncharacterized protein LOC115815135 [Chanos chanos]